jgi:CRISPR-associated protein Cas1
MKVQVILQAVALRDMGFKVSGQAVYFTTHKVRKFIPDRPQEIFAAEQAVRATADLLESSAAPPPLEDDPRCKACSHVSICLPDERYLKPVRRRIVVADPDTQVLHLTTPGTRASIKAGRVVVRHDDELVGTMPLERVQGVVVHGNVDISGALLRELLWRALPVVWCTSSGRVVGWASTASSPNGASRSRQHIASVQGNVEMAKQFVVAKITNQGTMLRRLGEAPETVVKIRRLAKKAVSAVSVNELLGLEGEAAALYFSRFSTMLKGSISGISSMFTGRSRRPSVDPINCALNFAYGLLLTDVLRAVVATGLDPHAGFLHSNSRNKPALALDLCEEFRAPVADSTIIWAFNNGELEASDFSTVLGATQLRPSGKKALITVYERRVSSEFIHPIFGYRVTWRRAMEVQARLVLGVIDGTQLSYKGICIR